MKQIPQPFRGKTAHSYSEKEGTMFEHSKVDGAANRIIPSNSSFVSEALLELREPVGGSDMPA